jgi:hypothetical protein
MERQPESTELLELGTASTDTLGYLAPAISEGDGFVKTGLSTD